MSEANQAFQDALDAELDGTPYRVVAPIGHGGMGALFEIEHRTLRRKLVMKILRDPGRPDLEDRLRVEAQALAQLSHPNLLAVVDFARTSVGRPYLVTERLYGKTLREVVGATDVLPVKDAVLYVTQALAGLGAAHRAGVIHRDVKLDNLFLCDGDAVNPPFVKVIDFGIVKLVGAEPGENAVDVAPLENPTAEGQMIGTPRFMSPEQVLNKTVDARADIYGIGVVLYRLVSGRYPFICGDVIEYAAAHATEIPKPPSMFARLSPELDRIILRALEKRPEDRFSSAREMIDALTPLMQTAAQPAPAASPRPKSASPANPHAVQRTIRMVEGAVPVAPKIEQARDAQRFPPSTVMLRDPPASPVFGSPPAPPPTAILPANLAPIREVAQAAAQAPTPPTFGPPPAPVVVAPLPPPRAPTKPPAKGRSAVEILAIVISIVSILAIVWFALLLAGVIH
ncbi:MAG: serine/threonine-protein kinase [Polyangiaceae bacterium]